MKPTFTGRNGEQSMGDQMEKFGGLSKSYLTWRNQNTKYTREWSSIWFETREDNTMEIGMDFKIVTKDSKFC